MATPPFLTQSAVLHTLTLLFLFISFSLFYSCLLCRPFPSNGTEEKDLNVCVCLLGQVNIWSDRGWRWLECWRRCLRAKWRTISETVIRCMHVDRATECSPWTVWCRLLRGAITRWERSIKLQSNTVKADSKNQTDVHACRKVLWPPHPVIIHVQWLAITVMPSHLGWHSGV